jgi:hypothetical protein
MGISPQRALGQILDMREERYKIALLRFRLLGFRDWTCMDINPGTLWYLHQKMELEELEGYEV